VRSSHFSDAVTKAITIDGESENALGVHIDGMLYIHQEVAAAADIDPNTGPSLTRCMADFEKIRAAGYTPLAVGLAQQWQIG